VGRVLAIFLAIVLVGGAGLFYASPLIAFYDVRSSARAEDVEALAKLINFTSVRTSLKAQLEAGDKGVSAPPPSAIDDPAGAAGKAVKDIGDSIGKAWDGLVNPKAAKAPVKPPVDVESYLKPRALLALTYGAGKDAPTYDPAAVAKPPMPSIAFFSLDRSRLTVKDAERGTTIFTFERKGLMSWEVTHVGLPKPGEIEAEKAAAAAASMSAEAAAAH
jgi:hypothetical protein